MLRLVGFVLWLPVRILTLGARMVSLPLRLAVRVRRLVRLAEWAASAILLAVGAVAAARWLEQRGGRLRPEQLPG